MIHIDFETFSTAGYRWDPVREMWRGLEGASKTGLPAIGAEVYAMHPSTRVICMAWDGNIWRPGMAPPPQLLGEIRRGTKLAAWNSLFERWIWKCCLPGWPELPLEQIVDGMPRARAWSIPGSLGGAASVIGLDAQKDKIGKSLVRKFCMPRTPTKLDRRMVILAAEEPEDAAKFEGYCLQDVKVETELAATLPQLSPFEQRVWELDQEINVRGMPVDTESVEHACEMLRQAERTMNAELKRMTGGFVPTHSCIAAFVNWIRKQGTPIDSLDKDDVAGALARVPPPPPQVQRALEIRQVLSSNSTKKAWAFRNRTAADGRIYGQFVYGGADRTLRWAGYGVQPHNFPRGDTDIGLDEAGFYGSTGKVVEWNATATEQFLLHLPCRDFVALQDRWGDAMTALSSSLRGLICAGPGAVLIGSDYTAIEAVILAVLAGEQWRVDVFRSHGKIYEASASKITGTSMVEYDMYAETHGGANHPDRKLGKLAELGSGYQGSVGAWLNFGAGKFFTPERCEQDRDRWGRSPRYHHSDTLQEYSIRRQVWAWRKASPNIVKFWEGIENAALLAVRMPGSIQSCRLIRFQVEAGVLYCTLPSGRRLAYHQVSIGPGKFGNDAIYYYGNTNKGWRQLSTYGGKLVENIVQATARDLLAHGMLNVEAGGYPIVMHVHDEIIAERPENDTGLVAEFEGLMGIMPEWAKDWPVRAKGGWIGKRFRK